MKIPRLEKKPEVKFCHDTKWEDNYSWVHQKNIIEVLKDSSKLLPEVRKYLEEENALLTQAWVMEPKKKVQDVLEELSIADLKIKEFYRIKIGE